MLGKVDALKQALMNKEEVLNDTYSEGLIEGFSEERRPKKTCAEKLTLVSPWLRMEAKLRLLLTDIKKVSAT